jgi:thiol-disulfide isomerase/thioredoxin
VPLQAGLTSAVPPQLASALVAVEQQPAVQEELSMLRPSATAGQPPTVPLEDLGQAPELTGITAWINSPPTTLAALHGKVVLVHFWTFGCINCIHVQPYVKAWFARYAGDGFTVLGVHTPELSFERDVDNVRDAVAKADVRFPVAFDPDYATWNAYRNSYWPAFYFVDKAGRIRHVHFGEGDYDGSEAVIRELLAEPAPA